ncbi:MAG: phosphotransferase [Chloroflexi bacterium]|nr:phosphotransferase [Chloroflexota bacterium]MYD49505.1 phosphotransferase [Chloroflexota bacterium]
MAIQPALPETANDITAAWLHEAIEAGGNADFPAIRNIAVEQIGVGVGLAGKILRCHLTYDDDTPGGLETVIVKLPSTDRDTLRIAKRLDLYRREYDYYRHVAPHAPIRSPALYYADFDDRSHHFVLVLEDLKAMAAPDQVVGADVEQAKTAVRAIAKLHGHYWNQIDLLPPSFLQDPTRRKRVPMVKAVYQANLHRTFDRFGDGFPAPMRRLAEEFGKGFIEYIEVSAAGPITFGHGDYRLDNMFFGPDDSGDFAVVDWQVCGISSGLSDVAYFLSSSVSTEIRRKLERELVAEYHDIISRMGAEGYTFEECWRGYRRSALACFLTPVIACGQFDFSSQRSQQLAEVFLSRTLTAMADLDVAEFLPVRRRSFSFANLSAAFYSAAYRTTRAVRRK